MKGDNDVSSFFLLLSYFAGRTIIISAIVEEKIED
jgi:hypothetical protein